MPTGDILIVLLHYRNTICHNSLVRATVFLLPRAVQEGRRREKGALIANNRLGIILSLLTTAVHQQDTTMQLAVYACHQLHRWSFSVRRLCLQMSRPQLLLYDLAWCRPLLADGDSTADLPWTGRFDIGGGSGVAVSDNKGTGVRSSFGDERRGRIRSARCY